MTYVEYYPCSGGSGCQQTLIPLTATTNNNNVVSVGDNNGGANGQSDHGILNGAASGASLSGGGGTIPTLTSFGFANPYFEDTITLSGGTGSVEVTATLTIDGSISNATPSTDGAGIILPTVSFSTGSEFRYAQLFLFQSDNYGEVELIDNTAASWTSPNGTFTQGNTEGIFPLFSNGSLTMRVNLPYNTPVLLQVDMGIDGYHSVATAANTRLTLTVPEGTTVTSESNTNYVAASTSQAVPMIPSLAFWLLALGLAALSLIKPYLTQKR